MITENINIDKIQALPASGNNEIEPSGLELFARLVTELSASTKTNDKLQSIVDYFAIAPDDDKEIGRAHV